MSASENADLSVSSSATFTHVHDVTASCPLLLLLLELRVATAITSAKNPMASGKRRLAGVAYSSASAAHAMPDTTSSADRMVLADRAAPV